LSHLAIPNIECVESRGSFGRFVAEPLEKGFGVTLGNALRRVLLGYLPGAAVTQVRIEGVQHEFSVIPYVSEDATEFLLNVKGIRLVPVSGQAGRLILEAEGEGRVCAGDIKPSSDFEIANPELYLATLGSPEAKLHVELYVELGVGYRQAESSNDLPIDTIPVDAIFTPIRKVNFTIEPIHIGREIIRERLSLEVWTDGTVSPEDALSSSAGILVEQLSPFADYARLSRLGVEGEAVGVPVADERYSISVDQLKLSVRTMNSLRRGGITTVGEIIGMGDRLLSLRGFGQKSKQEIEEYLNSLGLSLIPEVEEKEEEEEEENET